MTDHYRLRLKSVHILCRCANLSHSKRHKKQRATGRHLKRGARQVAEREMDDE